MPLIYKGKGEFINDRIHVPARDLTDGDIQQISEVWDLSIAYTEGLLIKSKLYSMPEKEIKGTAETAIEIPPKLHKPQFPKDSKKKSEDA